MDEVDLAQDIEAAARLDPDEFQRRAHADAEVIKAALREGTFDNPQAIIGLEYEFYAVADHGRLDRTFESADEVDASLMRVPRRLLEFIRFEKELGLHNAELATSPLPLNADGLRAQEAACVAQLRAAQDYLRSEGMRLVSDGLWTIPPQGETAREYLTTSVLDDGMRIASNMSATPRYHAMAQAVGDLRPAMRIDAPHVSLDADTVMPESLLTSIQPHYQVPRAAELPSAFRYALRIAAPLLAIGVNSPLFPPDLYDDVSPDRILTDAWHSHRIRVFESVLNPAGDAPGKVRFPRDIETVGQAIDRVVEDEILVPMVPETTGRFDDEFGTFRLKHGTYWRWVRPVFDGASRSAANARIEFRPLPGQPTVRDSIAFQAAFAGLMASLPRVDHPVGRLDWETAKGNFYAAAKAGLDADLTWITSEGEETTDTEAMYQDLLAHAVEGLRYNGLSDEEIGRFLGPLRRRVRYGITPASWKLARVREELLDGAAFDEAVRRAQQQYVRRQAETLFDADFGAWIELDRYRAG